MLQTARATFFRIIFSPPIVWFIDRLPKKQQAAVRLGDRGERLADRYLLSLGWVILERHYCDKIGEIDLIGVDGRTVVFVEVKTRSGDDWEPTEAVDDEKQKRITRTAKGYLKWHHLTGYACRFDVIAIIWPTNPQFPPKLTHYRAAFEAHGDFQLY